MGIEIRPPQTRQLDVIADTRLAADYGPPGSSTVPALSRPRGSSTVTRPPGSSTVTIDPRVLLIDRRRAQLKISNEEFARRAQVSIYTWRDIRRGKHAPLQSTLDKLSKALEIHVPTARPAPLIVSYVRIVMSLLAKELQFDEQKLFATDFKVQRPCVPDWLAASRIRMMALYITSVELTVENAELARATGDTRQGIKKARDRIEDLRDDPAIDAAIERVTLQVKGRG